MKKIINARIEWNREINHGVYNMLLHAPDISAQAVAGQFVELYTGMGELLLPRPISINLIDISQGCIQVVYQCVGKGTEYFSTLKAGDYIKVMGPLGSGFCFRLGFKYNSVAVVGGGIGAAPLLQTVKTLREESHGYAVHVYLGFRNAESVILREEFAMLGAEVHIATDDGSIGFHGNAVDLLRDEEQNFDGILACGPRPMLRAVASFAANKGISCQVSMEERMACGIGACVGCAIRIRTPDGIVNKKVCKDGPVFDGAEVVWDE